MAKTEECIRKHPREASLVSLGAGYLMSRLPLWLLIGGVVRLLAAFVKPAALLYGLYRVIEGYSARERAETHGG